MFSSSKSSASSLRRSFSSCASSGRTIAKVQALPREFFSHLIKLESDFQSNSYTVETLDELVQLYAKAVEYYDGIQDEISSYFTYKIQDILATKRSLKMLIDRKQQEKAELENNTNSPLVKSETPKLRPKDLNIDKTKFQNSIKESLAEESSDEEGEQNRRQEWEKKKEASKTSKSLASLKSQRQRFAQFYQKVEVEKNTYQEDMHVVFSNFVEAVNKNDHVVLKAINHQKQKLKQKLEQRKNKNFLTYTLNNTMSGANSPRGLSEQSSRKIVLNDENILQDLEDNFEFSNNKALNDALTPLLRKHLRSKSLFMKKEESSESKTALETRDNNRNFKEAEPQAKAEECLTPSEKLSTENSFTLNEANLNLVEL